MLFRILKGILQGHHQLCLKVKISKKRLIDLVAIKMKLLALMIKPCAPVDMKIIESAPSLAAVISGDDLTWPSSYRRHSFFTNDRNQTCLSVVPVFY